MNEPLSHTPTPEPTNITPFPAPQNGRPSLRSPELMEAICAAIRLDGLSDSQAGLLAGVSTSTLSRWKQEDEDFATALGQARVQYDLARLRVIRAACKRDGSPDWRAHAWLVQQSSPDKYGPPARRRKAKPAEEEERQPVDGPPILTTRDMTRLQAARKKSLERMHAEDLARRAAAPPADGETGPFCPKTSRPPSAGANASDPGVPPNQSSISSQNPDKMSHSASPDEDRRRAVQRAAEEAEDRELLEAFLNVPDLYPPSYYEAARDHAGHDAIPGMWTGA